MNKAIRTVRDEHAALVAVLRSIGLLLSHSRRHNLMADLASLRAMLFYIDEFPERRITRRSAGCFGSRTTNIVVSFSGSSWCFQRRWDLALPGSVSRLISTTCGGMIPVLHAGFKRIFVSISRRQHEQMDQPVQDIWLRRGAADARGHALCSLHLDEVLVGNRRVTTQMDRAFP